MSSPLNLDAESGPSSTVTTLNVSQSIANGQQSQEQEKVEEIVTEMAESSYVIDRQKHQIDDLTRQLEEKSALEVFFSIPVAVS